MRRYLLALFLAAVAGAALAQGMGQGLGIDDNRRVKPGPAAPVSSQSEIIPVVL